MKIRMLPEDFIVEEILDDELEGNECYIYKLTKIGIESFKAFSYMSKKFGISLKDIGYLGLKDRHAISSQYISLPKKYGIVEIKEKNLKLNFVGEGNRLNIGKGAFRNKFEIVVRDIKEEEIDEIKENLKNVACGIPNYFDEQRFGSVFNGKFIAREIAFNNFEEALKIYLTNYSKGEKANIKKLKRHIKRNWNEWGKCLDYMNKEEIKNKEIRNIIRELKKSNNYRKAFYYIDKRIRQIFVTAYQSYLWNECIYELLSKIVPTNEKIYAAYKCGKFLFYKKCRKTYEELKKFPMITPYKTYKEKEKEIIDKVLKKEKISMEMLSNIDIGKFNFYERKIIMKPSCFHYSDFEEDELNKGKYKIKLSFILEKGAYATIVIKRIFNAGGGI